MKVKRVFDQSVEFNVLYEGYINGKVEQIVVQAAKEGYNEHITIAPHGNGVKEK